MDKSKFKTVKIIIKFVAVGLVELFTGAVISSVMNDVEGGKLPRLGAYAGAALVGSMVGNQVGDFLCDELDEFCDDIDELKSAIESE